MVYTVFMEQIDYSKYFYHFECHKKNSYPRNYDIPEELESKVVYPLYLLDRLFKKKVICDQIEACRPKQQNLGQDF